MTTVEKLKKNLHSLNIRKVIAKVHFDRSRAIEKCFRPFSV